MSCGRHWSPSCPRPPTPTPPSPANVGIGLTGLHPASPNVSGCEHPLDGRALKWGFVSSLGVWRSGPFSSRRSPGLRPLTTHPLPSPHFYFKLSLAIYSYVRQLRQAESGFRPPGCPWCQHRHPGQSPALLGPRGGPRCASGESALAGAGAPARSPGSARAAAGGRGTPLNSRQGTGKGAAFPLFSELPCWAALRNDLRSSGLTCGVCTETEKPRSTCRSLPEASPSPALPPPPHSSPGWEV